MLMVPNTMWLMIGPLISFSISLGIVIFAFLVVFLTTLGSGAAAYSTMWQTVITMLR